MSHPNQWGGSLWEPGRDGMIGESIGRYQIVKKLGEGGMAIVYQAYDSHLDTHVALKIIRKERLMLDNTNLLLQRFEAEAKRVARLSNPNIIPILDYGKYENTPFLVMKFIPGGTLKDRMGKPIPWQQAARLLIPIARALSYAHQQGIVHRDVKPGNVLLTETGEPMLSDFGIAMMVLEKETDPAHDPDTILGTPEYMAPEQALGKTVDHRADIYALGLIFYEMITGRMPFTADTPISVLMKHIHQPLPPPRQYVPDLPEIAQRVVARALEKSPADRYATMDEFGSALKLLAQQENQRANHTLPLAQDEPNTIPPPTDKAGMKWMLPGADPEGSGWRNRILWAAAVFLLLLVVMGSGAGLAMLRANSQAASLGINMGQATITPLPPGSAGSASFSTTSTMAAIYTQSAPDPSAIATPAAPTESAAAAEATSTVDDALPNVVDSASIEETEIPPGSEEMQSMVQAFARDGLLPDTTGQYSRLADFEESWAQIGWYQWWFTGYEVTDFVIRAHTTWESASTTADWFNAGCGFVFREKDPANHYMIYLGLDGFVYLRGYIDGRFRELGKEYYGMIENVQGEANVMLVVRGDKIYYYVNGQRVLQRENDELSAGNLSYTLVSGTNRTFGTRCTVTDVELWRADSP